MPEVNKITSMFEINTIPITVMNVEHHGKVWLHSHDFFEMVYIEKGFALHVCDNTNTVLTSGDIFIIRPGQIHSYLSAYHTKLYNCLFEVKALKGVYDELCDMSILDRVFAKDSTLTWEKLTLDLTERREVALYLEKMMWEKLNRAPGWELKLKSLLVELLVLYSRMYEGHIKTQNKNAHFQYIYKALTYIEQNCNKDFFIKDIAEAAGISPDYFTKHFKDIIGISPMEYIKNYKIAKAMEQLKLSEKPIAMIAKEAGFSDISHFSRQFKQIAGVSPSTFRKSEKSDINELD